MSGGEFSWKNASAGRGALSAVKGALKYLVVPLVLVTLGIAVVTNEDGPQAIADILGEMRSIVLVLGAVLTVLSFFHGAYPKGTYSRLTFGLAISVLVIVYAYLLLLNGRTQEVIGRELFEVDLWLIFTLYFFTAIFGVLMPLGEFMDRRPLWLNGTGATGTEGTEAPEAHRPYHDFRLRYGSLYNGLRLARNTLTWSVVLPLIVIILLEAGLTSLEVEELDPLLSSLEDVAAVVVLLGLPMTALAFFKGFYPRGSVSRFIPAEAMVLIGLYWIWVIGLEGKLLMEVEEIDISLDYSGLLMLIMLGSGLWLVYYALEFFLYRKEWKEGGFKKDLEKKSGKKKTLERPAEPLDKAPQP
ncbi:MAG: hypothetical protein LLG21_01980 [Euryarchaeota archaeon]|nr:hypothetical protein [Euryarchaeota archaeon]